MPTTAARVPTIGESKELFVGIASTDVTADATPNERCHPE
jgi:hypothetical protein